MLRPRGPCGLEAKSFGLGLSLTLSSLGLNLGLITSGLGLIEIGLVASNIYSAHDINIHNIAIDISVVYWLLTENYVLNANILVFMLVHTELFSNVSGLGLMHCGLGLEKFLGLGLGLGLMPSWPR